MRLFPLLTALLATPALAADADRIGDLAYDTGLWRVEATAGGFEIGCRNPSGDCASLSARISSADLCTAASLDGGERSRHRRLARPGFDLLIAERDLGCRNRVPPSVRACLDYKGRTYRFEAPVWSCARGPGGGEVEAFLLGLRPG